MNAIPQRHARSIASLPASSRLICAVLAASFLASSSH
jgi:hypothetical protein